MEHPIDADRGDRSTGNGGQQGTAQGIAQRVPESGFERFEDEPGPEFGDLLFTQNGTLCNKHDSFLSANNRYMRFA